MTLWTTPALAQIPASPSPISPAPEPRLISRHFGSLTLGSDVNVTGVGIDTNVFDLSGAERRPADFTATVQPQVVGRFRTPQWDMSVLVWAGFVYYYKYSDQRAVNPGNRITLERKFSSHFSLYGSGTISRAKDRTGFEVESRNQHSNVSGTVGGRFGVSKLQFDLSGSHSFTQYDENARYQGVRLADTLDRNSDSAAASVGYRLSPYTTLTGGASVGSDRFPNSPERNLDWLRESAGISFSPKAILAGSFQAGWRKAVVLSGLAPDFSGLTTSGGLTYTFHDTTSLGIGQERDIEVSFSPTQPYYIYQLYEASARQTLFWRFDISATASRRTMEYQAFANPQLFSPVVSQTNGYLRSLTVSLGVAGPRKTRFGFYVSQWERVGGTEPYVARRFGIQFSALGANLSERGIFIDGPGR